MFSHADTLPNSDKCATCGGSGRLHIGVLDFWYRVIRVKSDMEKCHTCEGRGKFGSAAEAAKEYVKQS